MKSKLWFKWLFLDYTSFENLIIICSFYLFSYLFICSCWFFCISDVVLYFWIQFWVTSSFLNTLAWILQQMLFEYFTHACSVVILCLSMSYIKYNAFQSTFSQKLWTFVLRLKSWKTCEESSLRRQKCSLTESSSLLNFLHTLNRQLKKTDRFHHSVSISECYSI